MLITNKPAVPRSFLITCAVGWLLLGFAAFLYAQQKQVPPAVAIPVAAAFLIEFIFYLVPGFETFRERFARPNLSALLTVSALVPYLVYSLPTNQFSLRAFFILATLAAITCYWYRIFPPAWWADVAFIAFLTSIIISRILKETYTSPISRVPLDILGHVVLIHCGAMVILLQRRMPGIGFGFVPTVKEAFIGVRNFLYFIPFGAAAGWYLQVFRYRGKPAWQIPGVFLGVLWMVGLSEQFAFRGVLQQALGRVIHNKYVTRGVASVSFGLIHLWYPGGFPNWRMAILASIAGWFYGRAFEQAGGIRAAMVAHAITVTVWQIWLA